MQYYRIRLHLLGMIAGDAPQAVMPCESQRQHISDQNASARSDKSILELKLQVKPLLTPGTVLSNKLGRPAVVVVHPLRHDVYTHSDTRVKMYAL